MADPRDYHKYSDEIDRLIEVKRKRWQLKAIAWMNYDDVAQMIRLHIFQKFHQYNDSRPIGPWVNRVISNQFKNILRNNYLSFSKPCSDCPMDEGDDLCRFTPSKRKCSECPFYAEWEKRRKRAYDVKMPVSLDSDPINFTPNHDSVDIDIDSAVDVLRRELKKKLTKNEYLVFRKLYLNEGSDDVVNSVGYRQLQNYKKKILKHAKDIIEKELF